MPLAWNWLSVPWFVCATALLASALVSVLVRGDRVLRVGSIGASMSTLPWAVCSGISACTDDPATATLLLRLGNGPVALVGPGLLLVLLGVSGQLERHRWVARVAGVVGTVLCALCWFTPWTVSGVHRLSSGLLYPDPAPLSGLHFAQLGIWLAIGLVIARRSVLGGERRRLVQMLVGVLALGAVGMTDVLVVYDIAGSYPVAWLPATIAALIATYYESRSDLLRPQGFDRDTAIDLAGFLVMLATVAALAFALPGATPIAYAGIAGIVWLVVIVSTWMLRPTTTIPIARERALGELVASLGEVESELAVAERLSALWRELGLAIRSMSTVSVHGEVVDVVTGAARSLDAEVGAWLAARGELLAAGDLGTMRLGAMRPKLEALLVPAGAGLTAILVPLIDRGTLVGTVEADRAGSLREDERGLVTESARAVARALTYLGLARAAAVERETAREVEIAEAMRLQAAASRDDELGRWLVAAEYRTAPHTTGAGWSATLLADGRLAVLVTEAQAHGVAAALATAALTGAFAAATTASSAAPLSLDDLLGSLRASAEGVVRGGEPVAAFVALLDPDASTLAWATAGHPGGVVVASVTTVLGGGGHRLGATLAVATRGQVPFGPEALLVVASSAVRGDDDARWRLEVEARAGAGLRLAQVLVEGSARSRVPDEDLLAVVVRQRADRASARVIS